MREQMLVIGAFDKVAAELPFALRGVDSDNDSAFMSQSVFDDCKGHGLVQTRSRADKKNDQAWVEQKNGAIVRQLVATGWLWPPERGRGHNGPGAAVRVISPVHQLLSALVQAEVQDARRRAGAQGLSTADRCTKPGEVGALMRREGVYSSSLSTWRRQREVADLAALAPVKRGPKACPQRAETLHIAQLTRERDRLKSQLDKALLAIDVQKQLAALLGNPIDETGDLQ